MKSDNVISWISSGVTIMCGALATSEVLNIVLLVIGIVSACVSLGINIYVWYKKATADKKITPDEADELKKIVNEGTNDISGKVKDLEDETKKEEEKK